MKATNVILALVVIFMFGCAPAAPGQQAVDQPATDSGAAAGGTELPPLRIGVIAPLSGDAASYGNDVKAGVDLAVKELNDAGGINGRSVIAIYEDGKCSGKDATTAATKLIDVDHVPAIVGGACSSETLAFAPLAEAAQVAVISPSSSNPAISQAGDYIFRTWPSDAGQGTAIAKEIIKRGHHKVAVILMNKDYNLGLGNAFKENFESMGGVITAWELYEEDAKDFRTQVAKVRASKPDAIYVIPYTVDGALIVKQIRQLKMAEPIFSSETFGSKEVVEAAGKENAEGIVYATQKFDPTWQKASQFLPRVTQMGGKEPSFPAIAADAYDAVMLIADAVRANINQEPSGTIIKDYLYTVKDYEGAGGRLTIDANGDPEKEFQIMEIHNGEFNKAP